MAGRKSNQQITQELNEAIRKGIMEGLKEIAYQLQDAYGQAIDRFYADYEPHKYNRTYSTYMGSDMSDMWGWNSAASRNFNPYLKNIRQINKNTYYVALNVDYAYIAESLGNNPYHSPLEYVFERTYEKGIHGMTPEEASAKNMSWHKKPMREPPEHFMEKDYKKIGSEKNLDRIFGEAISRELSRMK